MSDEALDNRGRALTDAFLQEREAARVVLPEGTGRAATELADVCGITDLDLLQKLVDLGLTAMTLTALSIVPMLHVAWSDHVLDAKERKAILDDARSAGMSDTSVGYVLLGSWLTAHPNPALFEAWKAYHLTLGEHLAAGEKASLKADIMPRAERVARASGGFLGLRSISSLERTALDELELLLSQ